MMDILSINKEINNDIISVLKKFNLPLCDNGKTFISSDDKSWETILDYYLRDFSWANMYNVLCNDFFSKNCSKDILHNKGIYLEDDEITECPYNKITLLGNAKANLTYSDTEDTIFIAIKDSAELVLNVKNALIIIFSHNNAKIKVEQEDSFVYVINYSSNVTIECPTRIKIENKYE